MMIMVLAALLLAAPNPAPAPPTEEWVAEYIEYRCIPQLGHITISDGIVRGRRSVEYLRAHEKELAARGIFPCTDEERRRRYRRTDEMAGRRFETFLSILPPAEENGDWTRRVTVLVDGRKKVDCSVGDSPDGEVFVYGVTIFPEDGTIEVAAVDADGEELFPPQDLEGIDHPGVITDDVLQPAADEHDSPQRLERAAADGSHLGS